MSNEVNTSSDKSFYLIMLALIVGMGFYISYDMEQRYGSENIIDDSVSTSTAERPAAQDGATDAVVVDVEKIQAVENKTVSKIPAAKLKVESQQNTKPIAETSVIEETITVAKDAPAIVVPTMSEAAKTVSSFIPFTNTEEVTPKAVAPVVEEAIEETAAVVGSSVEAIPAMQPMQEFNPYNYSYRSRPQRPRPYPDNYYPQQRPYGYPNSNRYGGPNPNYYGNPYSNPNSNPYPTPYGYGYDQQ